MRPQESSVRLLTSWRKNTNRSYYSGRQLSVLWLDQPFSSARYLLGQRPNTHQWRRLLLGFPACMVRYSYLLPSFILLLTSDKAESPLLLLLHLSLLIAYQM